MRPDAYARILQLAPAYTQSSFDVLALPDVKPRLGNRARHYMQVQQRLVLKGGVVNAGVLIRLCKMFWDKTHWPLQSEKAVWRMRSCF